MNIFKKIIPYTLKRRIKENLGVPSLHWSLQNLKRKNFIPAVIIDVGAYEGLWTLDVLGVFPNSKVLMVEAQDKKKDHLMKVTKSHPNVDCAIALLSAENGKEKLFFENETGSQVINIAEPGDNSYLISTQTLDSLLLQISFPYPDFLKLDVQGYEIEVLKGAEKSLENAEVCLLEVSTMNLGDNTPLLVDVATFMDKRDFQAYDISQFMRRPFDKALFQIDMFFVKKNSFLVTDKRWA